MTTGPLSNRGDHETDFTAALANLEELVVADPPAAISLGGSLVPEIDRRGTVAQRIQARRLLAMAHAHTSQFESALQVCDDARALPDAATAPIELARVDLAAMQPLANLGRIDDAITAGKDALAVFEERDAASLAGRAALNTGAIYAMTGRPAEALPWFDRAAEHLAADPMLRGQIETNRGTALAALDRFQEAEAAFSRASDALSSDEMSWAQAIAEGNLADLAARQGEINRSLRHFEISRRHMERDEAWADLGRLNAEEAAALAMTGLSTVARETFTEAISMLREHGTPADLAMAQVAWGTSLVDAGELEEAERVLTETRSLIDADEYPTQYLQLLSLRARLAIANDDLEIAGELVNDAMSRVAGRPIQKLRWTIIQSRLARASGDETAAGAILRNALDQATKARITPLIADITASLAEIARGNDEHEAADLYARLAIEATEGVRGTIQADRIRQSWQRSRLDVYADLFRSSLARPDTPSQAEAFDIAERIRSRTLLDAMQIRSDEMDNIQPATGAERVLADERNEHRRWLNWMYSSLADGAEPDEEQLEELRSRERAAAQLDDRLATLRPPSALGKPLSLDTVQGILAPDHVILAYVRTGSAYSLQVISRDSVTGMADLVDNETVSELVAQLQFQLNRALAHGDRPIAQRREARLRRDAETILSRLYEILVAPVASHLSGMSRVIVIPSSDLYTVPFAALIGPDGYLVDHFEFTAAPGVSILAGIREAPSAPRGGPAQVLVAGVPDEAAPGLGEEARFVADRFPHATLLLEDHATLGAVLDALPKADLVHLACHGRFDSVHPTASGLRMADGWLTVDKLMDCRLNRPLVMLSGCETGRVRVERGDDLVGIIVALITSGVRGLVTSLWKTHDQAATAAMASYYDALMSGMDPVAALRISQQDVRAEFPHPAFWAPFVGVLASRKGA